MVERIRSLRRRGDVSLLEQDRLAQLARGHSQAIEAGKKQHLSARILAQLAALYGASMDYIYRGMGPGPSDADLLGAIDAADDRSLALDLELADVRKKHKLL